MTRKSALIADTPQGHHHRPRAQRHIQVVSKYALLDATFQHCHQVGVPSVIKLSKYLRDYRVTPGSDRQIAEHYELFGCPTQPQTDIFELHAKFVESGLFRILPNGAVIFQVLHQVVDNPEDQCLLAREMVMQRSVVYASFSRDLPNAETFQPVLCNQAVGYFNQLGFTVSVAHSLSFGRVRKSNLYTRTMPEYFPVNQMTEYMSSWFLYSVGMRRLTTRLESCVRCYSVRVAAKAVSAPQQVMGADRTFQTTE